MVEGLREDAFRRDHPAVAAACLPVSTTLKARERKAFFFFPPPMGGGGGRARRFERRPLFLPGPDTLRTPTCEPRDCDALDGSNGETCAVTSAGAGSGGDVGWELQWRRRGLWYLRPCLRLVSTFVLRRLHPRLLRVSPKSSTLSRGCHALLSSSHKALIWNARAIATRRRPGRHRRHWLGRSIFRRECVELLIQAAPARLPPYVLRCRVMVPRPGVPERPLAPEGENVLCDETGT